MRSECKNGASQKFCNCHIGNNEKLRTEGKLVRGLIGYGKEVQILHCDGHITAREALEGKDE